MQPTSAGTRTRIAVQPPGRARRRPHREPGAFAHSYVLRMEREPGERETWTVQVAPDAGVGYQTRITVRKSGAVLEASGSGQDGALATWDAMCRLEQTLRERRRS